MKMQDDCHDNTICELNSKFVSFITINIKIKFKSMWSVQSLFDLWNPQFCPVWLHAITIWTVSSIIKEWSIKFLFGRLKWRRNNNSSPSLLFFLFVLVQSSSLTVLPFNSLLFPKEVYKRYQSTFIYFSISSGMCCKIIFRITIPQ